MTRTAPLVGALFAVLNDELLLTSRDYGLHTNEISVEVETGVTSGTRVVTISDGRSTEQSPDLGALPFLLLKYLGGPPAGNGTGPLAVGPVAVDRRFSKR